MRINKDPMSGYQIKIDETRRIGSYELTTDHPASHYGIPALVDDDGKAYGPADIVAGPNALLLGGPAMTASDMVHHDAEHNDYTPEQRQGARAYLRQWPKGPQLQTLDEQRAEDKARQAAGHSSDRYGNRYITQSEFDKFAGLPNLSTLG